MDRELYNQDSTISSQGGELYDLWEMASLLALNALANHNRNKEGIEE